MQSYSDSDNEKNIIDLEDNSFDIKNEAFEKLKIIKYFMVNKIHMNVIITKFEKNLQYIYKNIFRCCPNSPKHHIKVNIRKNSLSENIKLENNTIYYLIFKCFLENYSLKKTYIKVKKFCDILENPKPTRNSIINLYRTLSNRIELFYHTTWKENPLGQDPVENGKSRIEIDKSEIIGNSNDAIWIFWLIDRSNKDVLIFCLISDRSKEKTLPYIKENVYTNDEDEETRISIYLDSFANKKGKNLGKKNPLII